MTLKELETLLFARGLDPESVSFGRGLPQETEKYCIEYSNRAWEVYYSERGGKSDLSRFDDEDSACRHLLALLECDETVWKS